MTGRLDPVLAVIDIGSNSGRMEVIRIRAGGHLEVISDSRAPLRLTLDVQRSGRFSALTIVRTVAVLRDFAALARSAGARRTLAVATEAVRVSANADELIGRANDEAGIDLRVISGEDEGRYSFAGAVHGIDARSGLVVDLGGGSLEITRFRERAPERSWTLPLGSLRVSDRFLTSDPPDADEVEAVRKYTINLLKKEGVSELEDGEQLVGTGGTLRNLAKIDRANFAYPIPRIHGYVLDRSHIKTIVDRLASKSISGRRRIGGLNRDRADSIVGGAVVASSLMKALGASDLVVSGQGLREGVALEAGALEVGSIEHVRDASIETLTSRFSGWDRARADRRASLSTLLLDAIEPGADGDARQRLARAAWILDVGRSVDYYQRHQHAADIVVEADLAGFSHRDLAFLAAVIRGAGEDDVRRQYGPLLLSEDREEIAREGLILLLADEIEQRMRSTRSDEVNCISKSKSVILEAPIFDPWRQESLSQRFRLVFGRKLVIVPPDRA
ncbi:MAG: Ppx/GppA family phosphatase [Actinomycetota bacterium]|nr:Ppx/GppA family phosphatase [Actinomycetota bacterium]